MSKEKLSIIATFFGEDILKMFMKGPLKDDSGIILGVADKSLGDNHLTLVIKNDEIQSHRTKTIDGFKERSYGDPIDMNIFALQLVHIVDSWERKIHGNTKVFVVKKKLQLDALLLFGASELTTKGHNKYELHHEISDSVIPMDMNDENSWIITRASLLSTFRGKTAFIILDDELHFIHSSTKPGIFYCPSLEQVQEFAKIVNQLIGLDDYLDEVLEKGELKGLLEEKVDRIAKEKNLQDDLE